MSGGFTAEAAVPLAWRGRLRHAARDALEWLLLPAVSAVMPWRWSLRFYRRVARSDRLFAAATRSVLAAAAAWHPPAEPTAWAAAYRLVQLIDRADLWLSRFRSDRWIDRHLQVEGDAWPDRPFVGITFTTAPVCGRSVIFAGAAAAHRSLLAPRPQLPRSSLLQHAYARARLREVERAGRAPVIYTWAVSPRCVPRWVAAYAFWA
jgi:hypothetical protein